MDIINSEMISSIKPSLLKRLIEMFFQQVPDAIDSMKSQIASQQATELRETAHMLKGSSMTIGATQMQALCQKLQHIAEANDFSEADSLLNQLEESYTVTHQKLSELL